MVPRIRWTPGGRFFKRSPNLSKYHPKYLRDCPEERSTPSPNYQPSPPDLTFSKTVARPGSPDNQSPPWLTVSDKFFSGRNPNFKRIAPPHLVSGKEED